MGIGWSRATEGYAPHLVNYSHHHEKAALLNATPLPAAYGDDDGDDNNNNNNTFPLDPTTRRVLNLSQASGDGGGGGNRAWFVILAIIGIFAAVFALIAFYFHYKKFLREQEAHWMNVRRFEWDEERHIATLRKLEDGGGGTGGAGGGRGPDAAVVGFSTGAAPAAPAGAGSMMTNRGGGVVEDTTRGGEASRERSSPRASFTRAPAADQLSHLRPAASRGTETVSIAEPLRPSTDRSPEIHDTSTRS